MKYGNRSVWNKIVASPITLVIVLLLLIVLIRATWNIHEKAGISATRLDEVNAELNRLKERQSDLSMKVQYLSTDQGLEAEMRTKYLAVKNGEWVAVIIDKNATTAPSVTQTKTSTSLWQRFLATFGW